MLPDGWQPGNSSAVEAYRFLADRGVLEIVFVDGGLVYDYPCDGDMHERFVAAPSRGGFVNEVLKPHAERLGWAPQPRPWAAS